jgi:2-polyprenyl-3-methyl-5-hydroxy-6-metoxy-1,4-benzoquinol methylase
MINKLKRQAIYLCRNAVYNTPIVGRFLRKTFDKIRGDTESSTQVYWDSSLSSWAKTYLGGTIQIDLRNAITALLIKKFASHAKSVLDAGCAGASLSICLNEKFDQYLGIDISQVAISEAKKLTENRKKGPGKIDFVVSDLQAFETSEKFDVIVFNEVLYYLKIEYLEKILNHYLNFLLPGGLIIISFKKDALSQLIHKQIRKQLDWVYGTIFQQQPNCPSFKIKFSRETPAFLVSVFRPKSQ